MHFNSLIFPAAFTIFIFLYYILKNNSRKTLLLICSLLFYTSFGLTGLIIMISVLAAVYISGIAVEWSDGKKSILWISIVIVLSFLVVFKYYNFFTDAFPGALNLPLLKTASPIGLSFYTFAGLSYIIEVYRKRIKAEKNIFYLAQFITFFPLVVSGPIERPYNILPQLRKEKKFDYDSVKKGLILVTLGFFKKAVIADRIADLSDKVFANPQDYKGIALIAGAVLFSIQIYCDFSGYTDIAIGIASIMGFKVMENFNLPYYAKSIQDFWTRWHISLSTWLRDYLFLPIAYLITRKLNNRPFMGMKSENWSYLAGISLTMLVCGLWHGANWTFIVWGLLHAFYLVIAFLTKNIRKKILRKAGLEKSIISSIFKTSFTFSLITLAWVFFKSESISAGYYFVSNIFSGFSLVTVMKIFSSRYELIVVLSLLILLELIHFVQKKYGILNFINSRPAWQRWGFYYFFIFIILIFGRFDSATFIYANF